MRLIRRLPFEWLPAISLAFIAPLIAVAILLGSGGGYKPIKYDKLDLQPRVNQAGGAIVLHNGLCNTTSMPLTAIVTVSFQENKDVLVARKITVVDASPLPLEPGCQFTDPLNGKLPEELDPGFWKLTALISVMGPEAGQIQRITLTSPVFEVVP